jgi:MoxR-like ATPase
MTIRPGTEDDIQRAIEQFDTELRGTTEWTDWETNGNYKYALLENDERYPLKKIISLATGTPLNEFSGGEESIRFAEQFDLSIAPLSLPTESKVRAALHDLLVSRFPEPVMPQDAYDVLAKHFKLSAALRNLRMQNSDEGHWENRVRQARRKLVAADVIDNASHGVWALADHPRRYWVEKSLVKGRPDREEGPNALGKALWSPIRDRSEGDIYRAMRLIEPGDVILHLIDNERIAGVSLAASRTKTDFAGVAGTDWADRQCYRIELRDYKELVPPIHRSQFLENPDHAEDLREILQNNRNLFYNEQLDLNQGAYLTEAPTELIDLFNHIYREETGEGLPHLSSWELGFDMQHMRAAILLFKWIYGDAGFASDRYQSEERAYKVELGEAWRTKITPSQLNEAISGGNSIAFAEELGQLLTQSNLVPWRYAGAVKAFQDEDEARALLVALRDLLFDETSGADIDRFNQAMLPRYQAKLNPNAIKAASYSIPSLALWLTYPDRHFFVRLEWLSRAMKMLVGTTPEQPETMTSAYYQSVLEFAGVLRKQLAALNPVDMIDVQGFGWGIFSHYKIWFGGKTYEKRRDVFPEFVSRQVYAIGFARREEIANAFKDVPALDKDARDTRRAELERLCQDSKDGERNALLSFFDLLAAPNSILLAKSTWYDNATKQSLLKVWGLCRTGKHVSFDEDLGHQVSVEWLSTPDHVVQIGEHYPSVVTTLSELPLEQALEIIGRPPPEEPAIEPAETAEDKSVAEEGRDGAQLEVQTAYSLADFVKDTGFDQATIAGWRRRLERKKHIVLQGPPGTGKTFVAERLARLLVSETTGAWDVLQFHPSYAYEDFMQGIRPQVISGALTYQIEPGRFLQFCRKAEERVDGAPCVLIIDELNRANISRVFGELMYLLEYRDMRVPLSIGGEEFQIPKNVFIIGTMNTADRSIALVDHALRRRFSFIHLGPAYDVLQRRLMRDGLPDSSLVSILKAINSKIKDRNYEIGISFFMKDGENLRTALPEIWQGEIEPYLEEFFYDQPETVEPFRWQKLASSSLGDWS